jgi:hypothetical protein
MKWVKAFGFAAVLFSSLAIGCKKEASKQTETKTIETPQGSTTVTTEHKVETKGKEPPPANP